MATTKVEDRRRALHPRWVTAQLWVLGVRGRGGVQYSLNPFLPQRIQTKLGLQEEQKEIMQDVLFKPINWVVVLKEPLHANVIHRPPRKL